MSMIVPQNAEKDTLYIMKLTFLDVNTYMRLYVSNITITSTTTLATLAAAQASFAGYAGQLISGWTTNVIDGSGAAASDTTCEFTCSAGGGSGNIYGYYLVDSSGTYFYGAELFSGGPIVLANGQKLDITLTYTVLSRY